MLYSNLPITKDATSLMKEQWASVKSVIHKCITESPYYTIAEKKALLYRLYFATGKGALAFRRMDDTGRQAEWLSQLIYMTKRGKEHTGHKVTGRGIDAKIAIVFVTSHCDSDISGGVYILFQK